MDINVLRNFLMVAKEESITRAALKLHVSQPSLSRQIKMLEKELGKPLFRRTQYKVVLTQTGLDLQERVDNIVKMMDLTILELSSKDRGIKGELSIVFTGGAFNDSAVYAVESFNNSFPNIKLKLYNGGPDYTRMLQREHKVDVVCTFVKDVPTELDCVCTEDERRMGLVMAGDDQLGQYNEIGLDMLSGLKLVLPEGMLIDKSYEGIMRYIDPSNIVATAEPPTVFLGMIRSFDAYVLGLEPPAGFLEKHGYVFRPLSPMVRYKICFIQNLYTKHFECADLFMNHLRKMLEERSW